MSVYAVFNYDITDPERFAQYMPGSAPIVIGSLARNGGELVFSDSASIFLAGESSTMTVCIKFPSAEAVAAWDNDPEYAPAKAHRVASTANNRAFIAKAFAPPA